jgi:hypothetical protein
MRKTTYLAVRSVASVVLMVLVLGLAASPSGANPAGNASPVAPGVSSDVKVVLPCASGTLRVVVLGTFPSDLALGQVNGVPGASEVTITIASVLKAEPTGEKFTVGIRAACATLDQTLAVECYHADLDGNPAFVTSISPVRSALCLGLPGGPLPETGAAPWTTNTLAAAFLAIGLLCVGRAKRAGTQRSTGTVSRIARP